MAEQGPYINQVEGIAIAQNTINSVVQDLQESIDVQLEETLTSVDTQVASKVDKTQKINNKALTADIVLDKTDIGLSNVDNTRDIDKPISTAVQTAINAISGGVANANPTDTPAGNINIYNANSAGTYTNFSGLVVSSADILSGIVQLRKSGNTWSKQIVTVDTLNVLKNQSVPVEVNQPIKKIDAGFAVWSDGPFETKEAACLAIQNVVVNGRNFREGKLPYIGIASNLVRYWWNGGFGDEHLVIYETSPLNRSVTPEKTTFFVKGKNIFNKDASFVDGANINPTTGIVQINPALFSYRVYDLMEVEPSTTYITNSSQATILAEYDEFGQFVKFNTGIINSQTITTDTRTRFVRVMRWQTYDNTTLQIEAGTVSTTFEPYNIGLPEEYIKKAILKSEFSPFTVVSKAEIGGDVNKIMVSEVGKNIFNKASAVLANSQISGSNGAVQTNAAFSGALFLDFFEIEASTTYISNSAITVSIAEYDADKKWIRNVNISGTTTFTSSANARFIRVWMYNGPEAFPTVSFLSRADLLQIEKGTVSTAYAPFKLESDIPISENAVRKSLSIVNNKFALPAKLYLLKGVENDISYQGFVKKWNPFLFPMRMTGTNLKTQNDRARLTPTASQVLKAELYNDEFELLQSVNVSTVIGDPAINNGQKNILIAGDSHVEPGFFQGSTRSLIPNVNFLGTRRGNANVNPVPIYTEGRGGWHLQLLFNSAYYNDVDKFNTFQQPTGSFNLYYGPTQTWINALKGPVTGMWYDTAVRVGFDPATGLKLNPAVGDVMYVNANSTYKYWDGSAWTNTSLAAIGFMFNITKYRQAFQIAMPDVFAINMGINDFSGLNPAEVKGLWVAWKGRMDTIITSAKSDNPDIKFAIIMSMSYFPDHFDSDVNSFSRMKSAAMFAQRELLIRDYDNRESENIFLVDFGTALDYKYAFHMEYQNPFPEYTYSGPTGWNNQQRPVILDNVHPDEQGHKQYARVFSAFIQSVR